MLSMDYIPLLLSLWKHWVEFSFMLTKRVSLFLGILHAVCITFFKKNFKLWSYGGRCSVLEYQEIHTLLILTILVLK